MRNSGFNFETKDKEEKLRGIANQLNASEGKDRPESYLERWQGVAGENVKVLLNNTGELISTIGRFIGLEMVNSNCIARVIINGISYYCEPNKLKFSND